MPLVDLSLLGDVLASPPPPVDEAMARAILSDVFGMEGAVVALSSERDRNFRLDAVDGRRYVLKVANPAEAAAVSDLQTRLLLHLATAGDPVPVARVVPARDGRPSAVVPVADCGDCVVRLVTFLEGAPLAGVARSAAQRDGIARMLALLTRALAGFAHPADGHDLLWDVANAARLLPVLPAIPDPSLRGLCEAALAVFVDEVEPVLALLPRQVVHNDFNPHNLVMDPADPDRIAGVLDFGDAVRTARVADLAVAASYHVADGDPVDRIARFAAAYAAVLPLTRAEADVLADLIAARLTTTVAIATLRAAHRPENAGYILRNVPTARAGLERLANVDRQRTRAAVARACGLE